MHSLRTQEKELVLGYFLNNFDKYTPIEIIHLCTLYCFVLDEFVSSTASNIKVIGANQSMATLCDKKAEQILFPAGFVFTRNTIHVPAKYHWVFQVSHAQNAIFKFDLWNENGCDSKAICSWNSNANKTLTLHIYLDTEHKTVVNQCGSVAETIDIYDFEMRNINNSALKITISGQKATIKLTEYYDSFRYMQQLQHDPTDALSNIGYARCIYNMSDKIQYYLNALNTKPFVEEWNNEYLFCEIHSKQFDVAYKHAMRYKKGTKAIAALVLHYYEVDNYHNAHQLSQLLDTEHIFDDDLYFELAYCCSKCGKDQNAVKYYEKYLDQHNNDKDDDNKENISICIANIARIHYKNTNFRDALVWFLKLNQQEIEQRSIFDEIAFCYRKLKMFDEAIKYYTLDIKHNPDNVSGYKHISYLYDEMNDHKTETQYLLKALQFSESDEEKGELYTSLAVNEYLDNNLSDAIKFGKMALEYFSASKAEDGIIIMLSNLGKYYYKIGEYQRSFELLSRAINKSPKYISCVGNYGIILFYLKRYNESIAYLEKCMKREQEIKDYEMFPDCAIAYAQIMHERSAFNESNDKCLQVIRYKSFDKYKDKYTLYTLMSANYAKLFQSQQAQTYSLKAEECTNKD